MYFYATRYNKDGGKITTSYNTLVNAKKYGGTDPKINEGIFEAKLEDGKLAFVQNPEATIVMRSVLENAKPNEQESGGRFVLFGYNGNIWEQTPFSAANYSAANVLMKSMIAGYHKLAVVEFMDEPAKPKRQLDDDEAPF